MSDSEVADLGIAIKGILSKHPESFDLNGFIAEMLVRSIPFRRTDDVFEKANILNLLGSRENLKYIKNAPLVIFPFPTSVSRYSIQLNGRPTHWVYVSEIGFPPNGLEHGGIAIDSGFITAEGNSVPCPLLLSSIGNLMKLHNLDADDIAKGAVSW